MLRGLIAEQGGNKLKEKRPIAAFSLSEIYKE